MKKKKKLILLTSLIIIVVVALGLFLYFYFSNPSRLTASEKRYLADNASIVQNFNVLNNIEVFGENGKGVYYDFIEDFANEYELKTNNVTLNLGENASGITFTVGNTVGKNEFAIYEGHYVLLSKKNEYMSLPSHLTNQKIGMEKENISYVTEYLDANNLTIKSYTSNEDLLKAFEEQSEIQYVIVPLYVYLNEILEKNYYVACHLSDISYYYKVSFGNNVTLGNILEKYFYEWKKEKLQNSYNEHLFNQFTSALKISKTEIDAMQSISYNYGFVTNPPYEILSGGSYGGIIAQYLQEFAKFSNLEVKFIKYKTVSKFINALQNNKINLYFGYYDVSNNYNSIHSGIGMNYSVIAPKKSDLVIQSLKSLNEKVIYVEDSSALYTYLKANTKAEIKTYKNERDLKRITKKGEIIVIDTQVYNVDEYDVFKKYNERYREVADFDYIFKSNANETFTKLFTRFVNVKNPEQTKYTGIYNYDLTLRAGTITGTIARYFMYILIAAVLIFLYVYKITKKVKVSKKIKKEDKLKYIDQLTSLKNRNYLSENLEIWSQNTIYPQAVVVIDLNNLQYINDTMGYEKGDEQIKAAANILVKNQLDNSDIIRTDGNEFVVYLINYQAKQITSYVHKLNKEFKHLPYEQGASIGYSMIEDDIKTIEDAMNEAVEEVKKQKENKKEDKA